MEYGTFSADTQLQALTYHPDRNPGRESEVTAQFQRIQSAHEVLIDATERAKYDAGRRAGRTYGSTYSGGVPSGRRGNPWASAGSQWAPPPKPPTARQPPPSAGAQRYKNFETPRTSANYAAQEGPGARKANYEGWESMKNQRASERPQSAQFNTPGPGRTWATPKPAQNVPKSGRDESNRQKHAPPPKVRPGYEEFVAGAAHKAKKKSKHTCSKKRRIHAQRSRWR